MLITRIKAQNFKTYLTLDLDLAVEDERPIILIGGANGGGKTTFFEAIYGALYGIRLPTEQSFREVLNAGILQIENTTKITLEIHFSGMVLSTEQRYILTRSYMLNSERKPVESVKLNMSGTIFGYGSASSPTEKEKNAEEINKIIKANLPQELSRYFLFDAMEAGNLLKADQLNRVIRENIENVMGFNKYIHMARTSAHIAEGYKTQLLAAEGEKKEYQKILEEKKEAETALQIQEEKLTNCLQYAITHKALYDELKNSLNQEETLKAKIAQAHYQIEGLQKKEWLFRTDLEVFLKELEVNICLPKLYEAIKPEIDLLLKKQHEAKSQTTQLSNEQIASVCESLQTYLHEKQMLKMPLDIAELTQYILSAGKQNKTDKEVGFLETTEIQALQNLTTHKWQNTFPHLHQQQAELTLSIKQLSTLEKQVEDMKAQLGGKNYNLLKDYEQNEKDIENCKLAMTETKRKIDKKQADLIRFDIQAGQEPDPKYELLQKLKPFFERVANELLKIKKQQIEVKMKQDLNLNLAAYRDVIDRVELSENLANLTFKIFHKAGNELYLNQLNTASKQIVVQVLLKVLHQFGDYDPPVMIDTVMGVLDETSRATVLESYFPELSHQTILLSSDSEIRTKQDLEKISSFIAKSYTLQRDRERQCTEVVTGYFGIHTHA